MGAPAIVTLTMNPAVDESACIERLVPERKLRCRDARREPGGGGINVARAIRRLGGESLAVYPRGGPPGDLLERLLDSEGVHQRPVPIQAWTRHNLNVLETSTRRQYRFVMPGPQLSDGELEACLEAIRALRPGPAWVVASGSLPPGAPADFYARVGALCRRSGARFVLDASGEPLRRAARSGVFLLKPSQREFAELTGESAGDDAALTRAARRFLEETGCGALVLSLGAAGALWTTASGQGRVASPAVPVRSSVGAGDALVAGIVLALSRGRPLEDSVRYGVAAAAASVMNPGTELCRPADAEALYAGLSQTAGPRDGGARLGRSRPVAAAS